MEKSMIKNIYTIKSKRIIIIKKMNFKRARKTGQRLTEFSHKQTNHNLNPQHQCKDQEDMAAHLYARSVKHISGAS